MISDEDIGNVPPASLTRRQQKLLAMNTAISLSQPDRADFLHTVMCQVGLPRSRTEARTFERHNGHMSMLLEAGKLWDGRQWIDQPLPYGVTPRLVMVHVSTEAIRTRNRSVEVGDSMRHFLEQLGMSTSGGERGGYSTLRRQINALAACRLTLGMQFENRVVTVDAKPIKRFEAWINPGRHDGAQRTLWPGVLELSQEFYDTLQNHAVPLDYRALAGLHHSALALDIYTWLAHRLWRINRPQGTKVSWGNLREQFGQEYASPKNFKREFVAALRQVMVVYPQARVRDSIGGLLLFPSRPPVGQTVISLSTPARSTSSVDKSAG